MEVDWAIIFQTVPLMEDEPFLLAQQGRIEEAQEMVRKENGGAREGAQIPHRPPLGAS